MLAAGALVWRMKKGRLQVLLVHRPSYQDWSWPKGKRDKGEALPVAAVREVEEETGYCIALGAPLSTVRYRLTNGKWKECHYWAAQLTTDAEPWAAARDGVKPAPKKEIDANKWVDANKAIKKLTYPHDRAPLFDLLELADQGRLNTRALVVVRHAKAKRRTRYQGSEASRPLTARIGTNQSERLTQLLAAFGVNELISSPWRRCRETVAPYARAAGIDITEVKALTEAAHRAKSSPVAQLVSEQVKRGGQPTALCTHRPVLETVMKTLKTFTAPRLRKGLPKADPWLEVGEMLVVHLATHHKHGYAPVALERYQA